MTDWLKEVDENARTCVRADDWFGYPFFVFVRHPHLQPLTVSRAFEMELVSWENRIQSHADARRALEGLDPSLRKQLAALIADIECEFENYKNRKSGKQWSKRLGSEGPRQQNMLGSKLRTARRALEDLQRYAGRLDPTLGLSCQQAAIDALGVLRHLGHKRLHSLRLLRSIASDLRPFTKNPTSFAMYGLYWFFHSGCRLSGDESEVRVALIRNAFWGKFDVAPVVFVPKYRSGESMGCAAVLQVVRRTSPQGYIALKISATFLVLYLLQPFP